MSEYVTELRGAIKESSPLLERMSDEETRKRPRPATLDYFMADYVAHLKHHLNQIVKPD